MKDVRVDSRGHVNLSFRKHKHDRYLYEEDPDGTIHLYPAVLVPARLKEPPGEGEHPEERDAMGVLKTYFPMAEEIS